MKSSVASLAIFVVVTKPMFASGLQFTGSAWRKSYLSIYELGFFYLKMFSFFPSKGVNNTGATCVYSSPCRSCALSDYLLYTNLYAKV